MNQPTIFCHDLRLCCKYSDNDWIDSILAFNQRSIFLSKVTTLICPSFCSVFYSTWPTMKAFAIRKKWWRNAASIWIIQLSIVGSPDSVQGCLKILFGKTSGHANGTSMKLTSKSKAIPLSSISEKNLSNCRETLCKQDTDQRQQARAHYHWWQSDRQNSYSTIQYGTPSLSESAHSQFIIINNQQNIHGGVCRMNLSITMKYINNIVNIYFDYTQIYTQNNCLYLQIDNWLTFEFQSRTKIKHVFKSLI